MPNLFGTLRLLSPVALGWSPRREKQHGRLAVERLEARDLPAPVVDDLGSALDLADAPDASRPDNIYG